MKCATCGFAASDSSVTVCPFCKPQGGVPAQAFVGPAQAFAGAAVWPPAPTIGLPPAYAREGYVDREALLKQRQFGMILSWCGFGVSFLGGHGHGMSTDLLVLTSLALFCVGYGHYAASKGYPRWLGWLLCFVFFIGGLILRILPDRNKL